MIFPVVFQNMVDTLMRKNLINEIARGIRKELKEKNDRIKRAKKCIWQHTDEQFCGRFTIVMCNDEAVFEYNIEVPEKCPYCGKKTKEIFK